MEFLTLLLGIGLRLALPVGALLLFSARLRAWDAHRTI